MVINVPRTADHDQRRADIAAAFQRLLARDGLGGTTLARVAVEAGLSVGLIQHYFDSKEQLLRFAFDDCLARREERIARHVSEGEAAGLPIATMLVAALGELVPLDERRRVEHAVVQSLATQGLHDETFAEVARRSVGLLHDRVVTAVENGTRCGEVAAGVAAGEAATLLLALTQGLASHTALGLHDEAEVSPALRRVVALYFTGRCRHHTAARRG